MGNGVRSLWTEPRAPDPPRRVWRDWVLVAALVAAAGVENLLRQDVPWRLVGVAEVVTLAFALLGRRAHPLAMVAVAFGVVIVVDIASIASPTGEQVGLDSMAFLLVLPYALFRWGSGREVVVGSSMILVALGVGIARDLTSVGDAIIGSFLLLVFPAVLGASVRFWTTARMRELDQVRLREREQLARELHDTVAHHVSAMVIRAQAGRVVAASQPDAAVDALKVIEAEGSRTLAEMRTMVGALREGEDADLAPQGGVSDIERLARSPEDGPRVEVHMSGDLDDLSPPVSAATYRIAQESVTNALRHARHAARIVVRVAGDVDYVRLTVHDDGEAVSALRATAGYGVVGMMERANLLGGTVEVGPAPDRGWVVDAVLPRVVSTG